MPRFGFHLCVLLIVSFFSLFSAPQADDRAA
jgi:hypothetical protein